MTDLNYLIAAGIAGWVLLMLAFPRDFMPQPKPKKTEVGPTFWGFYEGNPVEEDPNQPKIVLNPLASKKRKAVAGATTYALGRGVSMRM